jgi:drug/metabolite transporter (DMT)-like permease
MKAIVITMLVVEAAIFLVAIFSAVLAPSTNRRGRPMWSGIAISLIGVAVAASSIGEHHSGQPGADKLQAGAMVLIGMAIMTALMAIRLRRGLT